MSETSAEERWAIERSGGNRRRILAMAIGALLGVGLGLVLTTQQTTQYESTVRLLVGPIGADRSTLDAAGLLSRTYADVLASRDAITRVSDQLGVDVDVDDVTARSDERSRVILLIVRSDRASVPPKVATELANGLIELIEESKIATPAIPQAVARAEPGQVRVLDQATDPADRVRGSSTFVLFSTMAIGMLAGYVLASRVPTVRRTVDETFVESTGIPGLHIMHRSDESHEDSSADQVNAFDFAAVQLDLHCRREGPYRSVAFIPVDDDEQTPSVVLQLATTVARAGRSVEVVDADPEHRVFVPEVRNADSSLDPQSSSAFRVRANAERDGEDPSAMARLRSILARTSKHSLIAVLTPAAGVSPVTFSTTVLVDRVVVIVRRHATRKAHFNEVMQTLASLDVTPVLLLEIEVTAREPEARFIVPIGTQSSSAAGEDERSVTEDDPMPAPSAVPTGGPDRG